MLGGRIGIKCDERKSYKDADYERNTSSKAPTPLRCENKGARQQNCEYKEAKIMRPILFGVPDLVVADLEQVPNRTLCIDAGANRTKEQDYRSRASHCVRLTVKLRGRPEAPIKRRGRILSSRARAA